MGIVYPRGGECANWRGDAEKIKNRTRIGRIERIKTDFRRSVLIRPIRGIRVLFLIFMEEMIRFRTCQILHIQQIACKIHP